MFYGPCPVAAKCRGGATHCPQPALFRRRQKPTDTADALRLAEAAAARGVAIEAMGVHSLRSGGASALYHATGGNKSLVQRLGRWASEAFSGYVWEDRTLARGLASAMLAAPWAAHAAAY